MYSGNPGDIRGLSVMMGSAGLGGVLLSFVFLKAVYLGDTDASTVLKAAGEYLPASTMACLP